MYFWNCEVFYDGRCVNSLKECMEIVKVGVECSGIRCVGIEEFGRFYIGG